MTLTDTLSGMTSDTFVFEYAKEIPKLSCTLHHLVNDFSLCDHLLLKPQKNQIYSPPTASKQTYNKSCFVDTTDTLDVCKHERNSTTSRIPRVTKFKNKKRSVTFAPKPFIRSHIHINDYTDEEIKKTWTTSKEKHRMKKNVLSTIELMERRLANLTTTSTTNPIITTSTSTNTIATTTTTTTAATTSLVYDQTEFCGRGLELYVDKYWDHRRGSSIQAVMRAQSLSPLSDRMIAKVYKNYTKESRYLARIKGKQDAIVAAAATTCLNEEECKEEEKVAEF